MTVTVTLRERGSNAFLELRSLFMTEFDEGPARGLILTDYPPASVFEFRFRARYEP